jgi:hypothetical protein
MLLQAGKPRALHQHLVRASCCTVTWWSVSHGTTGKCVGFSTSPYEVFYSITEVLPPWPYLTLITSERHHFQKPLTCGLGFNFPTHEFWDTGSHHRCEFVHEDKFLCSNYAVFNIGINRKTRISMKKDMDSMSASFLL